MHPVVIRYFYVVDCKKNAARRATRFTHDYDGNVIDEIDETGPMAVQQEGTTGRAIVDTICGREEGVGGATPWDYLKSPSALSDEPKE